MIYRTYVSAGTFKSLVFYGSLRLRLLATESACATTSHRSQYHPLK